MEIFIYSKYFQYIFIQITHVEVIVIMVEIFKSWKIINHMLKQFTILDMFKLRCAKMILFLIQMVLCTFFVTKKFLFFSGNDFIRLRFRGWIEISQLILRVSFLLFDCLLGTIRNKETGF